MDESKVPPVVGRRSSAVKRDDELSSRTFLYTFIVQYQWNQERDQDDDLSLDGRVRVRVVRVSSLCTTEPYEQSVSPSGTGYFIVFLHGLSESIFVFLNGHKDPVCYMKQKILRRLKVKPL